MTRFKSFLVIWGSLSFVVLVGYFDYITGPNISLRIFYLFPLIVTVWFSSVRLAFIPLTASVISWFCVEVLSPYKYTHPILPYWNILLNLVFFVFITYLLSKLKQSIEKIKLQNKKLKELEMLKDNLTQMIIHDLNSPLATVVLVLQSLKLRLKDKLGEREKESLKNASVPLEDIQRMISNLLDISKMEEGKIRLNIEDSLIQEIAGQVIGEMENSAAMHEINLAFDFSGNIPPVPVDKDIIKRVITNLINNALKCTPSKGSVSLEIFYKADDNEVGVRVKDSGSGIPEEYLDKIFDKFFQAGTPKVKMGHGLGLTFCKLMVEAHGGKIWAESDGPGKGSTVTFTLPCQKN